MQHNHDHSHENHGPAAHGADDPNRKNAGAQAAEMHMHRAGAHAGHDKHAVHSIAMFRRKFWLSLVLTIPTLVWGHMLQQALGYSAPHFSGATWIPPVFGTAVFAYGGWVFIQGAIRELRDRLPGMMTLIALGISVAFLFSAAVTLGYPGMPLWEELSTLVTIMLLGHWIEMRSMARAQGALKELAKLLPDTAVRVVGDRMEEVSVSELREGDIVLVRPGANIPADGIVRQGESPVNESMITGESRPVHKEVRDKTIAGTVNGSARYGSKSLELANTPRLPGS
jgi:Cu2+-exporting ATPase